MEENARQMLERCLEEEAQLQFDSLSPADIWRLGCILKELADACGKPMAVEIKVNGLLRFRYYPTGAGEYYNMVMTRKHNTANVLEKSSLRFYAENQISGLDPAKDMLLDPNRFQFRGGAFPIRLRDGCVIGSIVAAGGAHTEDHALIVRGLTRYFAKKQ